MMRPVLAGLILFWFAAAPVGSVNGQPIQPLPTQTRPLPRCQVIPLPDHQASFRIDGLEKTRWYFGDHYPRPFFYPLAGPSGEALTRMGHPAAPDHDHHQSIWFAHNRVDGLDFWGNGHGTFIRQKQWTAYEDGDSEAVMAAVLGWSTGDGRELLEQEIVAALLPMAEGEHALEIQFTLRPSADAANVDLDKTNFGFLAVRVAKGLSPHFGGGQLTNSEGQRGESQIFAQPARWMDFSGSVAIGEGDQRTTGYEGITYFDHPNNPRYPSAWHVRDDGWMAAAFCLHEGLQVSGDAPLTLRYLLHAHRGVYDSARAAEVHHQFATRSPFSVTPSTQAHHQYQVQREQ